MSNNDNKAQTEDKKVEAETKVVEAEATVGELLGKKTNETAPRTVPEATFLEMKKKYKELSREVKEKADERGTLKNSSLKELADKHNLDEDFLEEFANSIKKTTKSEMEEEIASKLEPFKQKENQAKLNNVFDVNYKKVLNSSPQYKDIANKDVIKTLALDPNNSNKTIAQLVELSYGHLVGDKKSIDSASTKTYNNNDTKLNRELANKDSKYFDHVMATPSLKAEYNKGLTSELAQYL